MDKATVPVHVLRTVLKEIEDAVRVVPFHTVYINKYNNTIVRTIVRLDNDLPVVDFAVSEDERGNA